MSADGVKPAGNRLFLKKSIAQIQKEAAKSELKRTLGPLNLMSLGIGAIIGAGIFVLTGQVASAHAGPAIMFSFVIAGIACGLAGLCYAELASTMPVSGSAYTYAYGTLGEIFAWIMGWLLVLEYGVAASTVAVGWSGYVVSILSDFGVSASLFPTISYPGGEGPQWATPLIQYVASGADAGFPLTGTFNLVAAVGIAAVCGLLVLGVSESANINNAIVVIKIIVLLTFIAVGLQYINPANWDPFIPPQGDSWDQFGVGGIFRGASIIFFAYVGFEAVSTAAAEAKNPSKDVPIGILGALFVCTLIYMVVAAVMTGVVPYLELASPAPIAVAIDRMALSWADVPLAGAPGGKLNMIAFLIKIGAITGLSSVMLVLCYGQTRIFYTMARRPAAQGVRRGAPEVPHSVDRHHPAGHRHRHRGVLPAHLDPGRPGVAGHCDGLRHRLPVGHRPAYQAPGDGASVPRSGRHGHRRSGHSGLSDAGVVQLRADGAARAERQPPAADHPGRLCPGRRPDLRPVRLRPLEAGQGRGHHRGHHA
jgi:APA family basic amino acid/polyamine antiporter